MPPMLKPVETKPNTLPICPGGVIARMSMSRDGETMPLRAPTAKRPMATTMSGTGSRLKSVSCQFRLINTALMPIRESTLTVTSGMACAISVSNSRVSLTVRDINSPVCLSS